MDKKIVIKPEFKCETVYSELNKLIKRILAIHNNAKTETGYAYKYDILKDFEGLKLILLNILYEKTDIKKILNENKYYLDTKDLDNAFSGLDSTDSHLYERFLSNLNKFFDIEERSFSFIFPLNLDFKVKNDENYLKILEQFNIEKIEIADVKKILDKINTEESEKRNSKHVLSYSEKRIKKLFKEDELTKEDVLDYLKDYPLILFVETEARNSGHSERLARMLIESFLGFLSYSENFLSQNLLYFDNIRGKKNFNEIKYEEVVILEKNRILWPNKHIVNALKKEKKSPIKFKGHDTLVLMYKDILTIENEELWEMLRKSFFLYYTASSEEIINYSFLNFWIIAETLIKGGKAKSDEEVKHIMKSMVRDDILKKRINFLDKKRNSLVHKGENVTVGDRDLIKIIADLLLLEAMRSMGKLKDKKQFEYYLSNIRTKKNDREKYIEVLSILNEQEKENS